MLFLGPGYRFQKQIFHTSGIKDHFFPVSPRYHMIPCSVSEHSRLSHTITTDCHFHLLLNRALSPLDFYKSYTVSLSQESRYTKHYPNYSERNGGQTALIDRGNIFWNPSTHTTGRIDFMEFTGGGTFPTKVAGVPPGNDHDQYVITVLLAVDTSLKVNVTLLVVENNVLEKAAVTVGVK